MSDAKQSSSGDTAEEYSRRDHLERYGMEQYQPGLDEWISVSWTGSARELIRDQALDAWRSVEPRGCILAAFERHESVVRVRSFPQAKALYGLITDELNRRRIDGRQRNSLHNARDQLVEGFEAQQDAVKLTAKNWWNGHQFRAEGEIPRASISQDDVRLDAPVEETDFVRGRVRYHLGTGNPSRHDDAEIERVVDQLPVMYGYDG